MDIQDKLTIKLKELSYSRRLSSNMVITDDDITEVFDCLSKYDQETKPLLESIKQLCLRTDDRIFIEDQLRIILKYFNIIENTNITNCRHMFLFNESRKLVKTKFFSSDKLSTIKNILNERKILQKLEVNDAI